MKSRTRRSKNDNTSQPLDQWTNIPFMGQQVGNYKSIDLPIPKIWLLKNLTLKIQGQDHGWGQILKSQLLSNSCLIQLFQNWTLKIQVQCHGWGQSSKSQCESNILSTRIPFVPCQSGIQLLRYDFFKVWPWKSRVKVMGDVTLQSHNVGLTSYRLTSLSFHVNRASHSWVMFWRRQETGHHWHWYCLGCRFSQPFSICTKQSGMCMNTLGSFRDGPHPS